MFPGARPQPGVTVEEILIPPSCLLGVHSMTPPCITDSQSACCTHMHAHAHACTQTHGHKRARTHTDAQTQTRAHTHAHARMHTLTHTCTHLHRHTTRHTHTHMYRHTHMHTHTHRFPPDIILQPITSNYLENNRRFYPSVEAVNQVRWL